MPPSPWCREERTWLFPQAEEWRVFKANRKNYIAVNGIKLVDQWMCNLVDQFLEVFPNRQWSSEAPTGFSNAQEYRACLLHTLKQFLNNKCRKAGGRALDQAPKIAKHISSRHLLMQEYKDNIKSRAANMLAEQPDMGSRRAWNFATSRLSEHLEKEDPEAFAQLARRAEDMRRSGDIDFTQQEKDVLEKLLQHLPKQMAATAHAWGKSTGALVYFAAMFDTEEDGIQFIDASSDDLDAFLLTKTCEHFWHEFGEWVRHNRGLDLNEQINTADETVYPDREHHNRPCIPDKDALPNAHASTLHTFLRHYFSQLWKWQGGRGAPPYTKITQDCLSGDWSFINKARMPPHVPRFSDPHRMDHPQLLAMYDHICASQKGLIPAEKILQFAIVLSANGTVIAQYQHLCSRQHPSSSVEWTTQEKLYARKLEKAKQEDLENLTQWNGLPPARLIGVYRPFTSSQADKIRKYSSNECDLAALISLGNQMEDLGAAHVGFFFSPSANADLPAQEQDRPMPSTHNPYFPTHLQMEDISRVLQRIWPNEAFFDTSLVDHADHALSTLIHFVRTDTRMRHTRSTTWLGGPGGLRWVIVVFFHIVQALHFIDERHAVPVNVTSHFSQDLHTRNWQLIRTGVSWMHEQLADSCAKLRESYTARAGVWKIQVQAIYDAGGHMPSVLVGGAHVFRSQTFGVPLEESDLHTCYQTLQQITEISVPQGDAFLGRSSPPDSPRPAASKAASKSRVCFDLSLPPGTLDEALNAVEVEFTETLPSLPSNRSVTPKQIRVRRPDKQSTSFVSPHTGRQRGTKLSSRLKTKPLVAQDNSLLPTSILVANNWETDSSGSSPEHSDSEDHAFVKDSLDDEEEAELGDTTSVLKELDGLLSVPLTSAATSQATEVTSTGRPRRSIVRDPRVDQFIQQAKKGSQPKPTSNSTKASSSTRRKSHGK